MRAYADGRLADAAVAVLAVVGRNDGRELQEQHLLSPLDRLRDQGEAHEPARQGRVVGGCEGAVAGNDAHRPGAAFAHVHERHAHHLEVPPEIDI